MLAIDELNQQSLDATEVADILCDLSVVIYQAQVGANPRYAPLLSDTKPPISYSSEVCVASAACELLSARIPSGFAKFQNYKSGILSNYQQSVRKSDAISYGIKLASYIAKRYDGDVLSRSENWSHKGIPGTYFPAETPDSPNYGDCKPWGNLPNVDSVMQDSPNINSLTFMKDLREVFDMGRDVSVHRKLYMTQSALFWSEQSCVTLNVILSDLHKLRPDDELNVARIRLLLNVALKNSFVLVWKLKYKYNFWRPITAIRSDFDLIEGERIKDNSWHPLLRTPRHPEFPSGHSTATSAALEVLKNFYSDAEFEAITIKSSTSPSVSKSGMSPVDIMNDVTNSRVWGGVHFRASCEVGETIGRLVGQNVLGTIALQGNYEIKSTMGDRL